MLKKLATLYIFIFPFFFFPEIYKSKEIEGNTLLNKMEK